MTRSLLRYRTSIIRSSVLVQASSSLSMGRTRSGTAELAHHRDINRFFAGFHKGYSNSCETKEADLRFEKYTLDSERWSGHIKGGMFTRRSPQFTQVARLDEILVHAGNNQLPQDLEELSTQGFEFHIHTAHHVDSNLDHKTLTADLPATLLLRPM